MYAFNSETTYAGSERSTIVEGYAMWEGSVPLTPVEAQPQTPIWPAT